MILTALLQYQQWPAFELQPRAWACQFFQHWQFVLQSWTFYLLDLESDSLPPAPVVHTEEVYFQFFATACAHWQLQAQIDPSCVERPWLLIQILLAHLQVL